MQGTTDGGLLVLPEESSRELRTLMNHGYRFVVVDPRKRIDERVPTVVRRALLRRRPGARATCSSLGHRRIAAITGPRGWMATEERQRGYRAALAAAGVLPDPELVIESNFELRRRPRGRRARCSTLPSPPTAIFAFNDQLAIGAMHAALARGLRIPEDLSIVGFDDTAEAEIVIARRSRPCASRSPRWGGWRSSLLTRLLENQRLEALHVELATQLIVRGSTAPPRLRALTGRAEAPLRPGGSRARARGAAARRAAIRAR